MFDTSAYDGHEQVTHFFDEASGLRGIIAAWRQHRLVTAVHPVEVADGERAFPGDARVLEAAEDLHPFALLLIASGAGKSSAGREFVMERVYCASGGCRFPQAQGDRCVRAAVDQANLPGDPARPPRDISVPILVLLAGGVL